MQIVPGEIDLVILWQVRMTLLIGKNKKQQVLDLRNKWYERLKKEGFADIEHTFDDNSVSSYSKNTPAMLRSNKQNYQLESIAEYYGYCREFRWVNQWEKRKYLRVLRGNWDNKRIVKSKLIKNSLKTAEIYWRAEAPIKIWLCYCEGHDYRTIGSHFGYTIFKIHEIINLIKEDMNCWLSKTELQRHQITP